MNEITFGSLFAGIGGFDLGFERAGMTCKWQVEIDDYCRKVLAKHWPKVKRYDDIRRTGKHNLQPVDVICGGFPCQPYSIAGEQKGETDDRNLWPEFLRIVKELRPSWVVAENVPGIVSLYLDTVLSDLESEDYSCWTFNIPACALDAPHRRERIFIVANSNSQGLQRSQLRPLAHSHQGRSNPKPPRSSAQIPPYPSSKGLQRQWGSAWVQSGRPSETGWWEIEPDVGRVVDGLPSRVDRLKSLGNAVVPHVAEFIALRIVEVERENIR